MKYIPMTFFVIFIFSCSPRLSYLGDTHLPTQDVDIYFSSNDIANNYKVIGQLRAENLGTKSLENLKNVMIEYAKERGAHAILFLIKGSLNYKVLLTKYCII